MNKIIVGIIVVVIILSAAFYLFNKNYSPTQMQNVPSQSQSQTPASGNAITIQNFEFAPATLNVKVGDKVTWTNQDSTGHSATADDGTFDTGIIGQGESGSFTFSKAGTYTYHCSVHPMMKGTIIVK